jgi:hypothetical protein
MLSPSRFIAVAAALAAGMLMVACSGDGDPRSVAPDEEGGSSTEGAAVTAPSAELYGPRMKQCIEPHGFDVSLRPDGGIEVEFGDDDTPADVLATRRQEYEEVWGLCLEETGYDRPASVDPHEDFRHLVAVDDCIRARGYPVVSPTFEEFQSGVFPNNDAVLPQDGAELQSLYTACEN